MKPLLVVVDPYFKKVWDWSQSLDNEELTSEISIHVHAARHVISTLPLDHVSSEEVWVMLRSIVSELLTGPHSAQSIAEEYDEILPDSIFECRDNVVHDVLALAEEM